MPRPPAGSVEWREAVQRETPNAYVAWTPEEDARLAREVRSGRTIKEMADGHQRQRGAIRSRVKKLGLGS